jgi:hypothetical protein
MSNARLPWIGSVFVLAVTTAIACTDSNPAAPATQQNPLKDGVQLQSPDTANGTGGTAAQGDGSFHGSVKGYNEADFPDTLKSVKPLANVTVTAYHAELTNADPKLGAVAAKVSTNADGQFTLPTLTGGLYVVTFTPAPADAYDGAWTIATASSKSGDLPWVIMLRAKR